MVLSIGLADDVPVEPDTLSFVAGNVQTTARVISEEPVDVGGEVWTSYTFQTADGQTFTTAVEGGDHGNGLRSEFSNETYLDVGENYRLTLETPRVSGPDVEYRVLSAAPTTNRNGQSFSALDLSAPYDTLGSKWQLDSGEQITWDFVSNSIPEGLAIAEATKALQAGFDTWLIDAAPLVLQVAPPKKSWVQLQVKDWDKISSVQWVTTDPLDGFLARTRTWVDRETDTIMGFDIVFNNDYRWSTDNSSGTYDITSVAIHEVGHALGLRHHEAAGSIMSANLPKNTIKHRLSADDIKIIQSLYSPKGGSEPNCFGRQPTLVGTPGDDILSGTAKRDVIVGLGGDDKIIGLGGNDLLCGGAGNDTIKGGKGRDLIAGGRGDDTLKGGRGNDTLKGQAGDDRLIGGKGADRTNGGAGNNQLTD